MEKDPIESRSVETGAFAINMYSHTIRSHLFESVSWLFLTDGLMAQGQKELVLCILQPGNPDQPPEYPFAILAEIADKVAKGKRFTPGAHIEVNQANSPNALKRFVCVSCPVITEIAKAAEALALVSLTNDEYQAARDYGFTRVLTMLGKNARYFPNPYWADPERASVIDKQTLSLMKQHPVSTATSLDIPDGSFYLRDSILYLHVTADLAGRLAKALSLARSPVNLNLLLSAYRGADACLVWQPNPQTLEAITANQSSGSCLTGSFLHFIAPANEDLLITHSDGFSLALTKNSFDQLKNALAKQSQLSLQLAPGERASTFRLICGYHQYVDGDTEFNSAQPINLHKPTGSVAAPNLGNIAKLPLVFLTAAPDLERRIEAKPLVNYCLALEQITVRLLGAKQFERAFELQLICELFANGSASVKVAVKPEDNFQWKAELQHIVNQSKEIAPPEVKHESVSFIIRYKLGN